MSSADSSDEEDLAKFREAADAQFINDSMYNNKCKKTQLKAQKPPSLRTIKNEGDQFNSSHITPEFRNCLAKHLSSYLDQTIKYTNMKSDDDDFIKPKRRKSCIKLFKDSQKKVKATSMKEPTQKPTKRKAEMSDDDEEKCRSVAVSSEHILAQTDTKHWSTRIKGPVYNYIKTNQGLILK